MPKTAHKVVVIGHRNPDTDSICSAIGQPAFQRRADAAADLFLGLIHDGSVFGGVGRGRNDLEKIAARRFGDLPRHGARIAAVGEIGHQHLRAGCGLRLCIHIG